MFSVKNTKALLSVQIRFTQTTNYTEFLLFASTVQSKQSNNQRVTSAKVRDAHSKGGQYDRNNGNGRNHGSGRRVEGKRFSSVHKYQYSHESVLHDCVREHRGMPNRSRVEYAVYVLRIEGSRASCMSTEQACGYRMRSSEYERIIERLEETIEQQREEIIELKDVIEELKKGGEDD